MPIIAAGTTLLLLVGVLIGAIYGALGAPNTCQPHQGTTTADQIPPNYLALYQKAGTKYGIPWPILAAVGGTESDHGRSRSPGVHSGQNHAGAAGPMQFLASTWATYGVDGNHDGHKNPYDPADAVPAAARYLKANGAPANLQTALFVYNHSTTYVNTVLARAHQYAQTNPTPTDCPPPETLAPPPNEAIARAIAFALAQRGKPYVFGAAGPNAWDCSSLVQAAYRAAGYTIPRTTFEQWPFGVRIPKGTEQPGDLVFFNSGPNTAPGHPGHVGMVIAPGQMIAARCSTCRPAIGVQSYRRPDWIGTTRPLLRLSKRSRA